jgi:hypothetical protein
MYFALNAGDTITTITCKKGQDKKGGFLSNKKKKRCGEEVKVVAVLFTLRRAKICVPGAGKDAYWKFFFCTKAISFNALRHLFE